MPKAKSKYRKPNGRWTHPVSVTHPHLLDEWDPKDPLRPESITAGSYRRVGWRCSQGHRWRAAIATRVRGPGCPQCVTPPSLSRQFPGLKPFYHPTKNRIPFYKVRGLDGKHWWTCGQGHVFLEKASNVAKRGRPRCSRCEAAEKRHALEQSLATEWNSRNEAAPDEVKLSSNTLLWWRCKEGHEWRDAPYERARGRGCPYCEPDPTSVLTNKELVAQWDAERNELERPWFVGRRSRHPAHWRCPRCSHRFVTSPFRRKHSRCPACQAYRVNEKLLQDEYPELAAQYDQERNPRPLATIPPRHGRLVWWRCQTDPRHRWQARPSNRVASGHANCLFCSGWRVLEEESLAVLYPNVAKFWDASKHKRPRPLTMVSPNSTALLWWRCEYGHSYRRAVRLQVPKAHCTECEWRLVSIENSIATHAPLIAAQWDKERNEFPASRISPRSSVISYWRCPNGHVYRRSPRKRVAGVGCEQCGAHF